MSDSVWRNRELSDEAKKLEDAGQFDQAAELYKQSYELYPSSYVASGYIKCLRKQGKSMAAVEFGRQLSKQLLDDSYVHKILSWAIYDVYLKKTESKDDNEVDDVWFGKQNNSDFEDMQKRARYILKRSLADDTLLSTKTVFAICREAKLRDKWQIVYDFAMQLNPEQMSSEKEEWNGRKLPSDYQRWLYLMVRSLLEVKRNDECITFATKGIDKFPNEKLFYWWQARAKLALGQINEALNDLEHVDTRFPKEWYIQHDIASIYLQLQQYDEAWIWFCKAASSSRLEDLKGRFKMFQQMSVLLEHLGRWQEAYDHLQLACAIVERERWEHRAEGLNGQLLQFRNRHTEHIAFSVDMQPDILITLFRRCKVLWQETIRSICISRKGYITKADEEKGYGFVRTDNDSIHFRFRDVIRGVIPKEGMEVEFETEKAIKYNKEKNEHEDSIKAVNIRPVRRSV
jgi:tetratricopeptide (TPR) repeat protein